MNKAIILAGGQGKRMKADMPKPLFKVLGDPMLEWVIAACESAGVSDILKGRTRPVQVTAPRADGTGPERNHPQGTGEDFFYGR